MVNDDEDGQEKKDIVGSYFLELWRLRLRMAKEKLYADCPAPKELDPPSEFAMLSQDRLSVYYRNEISHVRGVGAVCANCPAPVHGILYYFEIRVENAGAKGQIAIGFATAGFPLYGLPGWEEESIGYFGNDGRIYLGFNEGKQDAKTYTTGDTVGAGINYGSNELFFTKNKLVVGTVDNYVVGRLYPTIVVQSQDEKVKVNFGKDPFLFNITKYEAIFREMKSHMAVHGIVRSYLQHYGYTETQKLFDEYCRITAIHEEDKDALRDRSTVRMLIMKGRIDDAFDKLRTWYPETVEDGTTAICFILHYQKIIELIRDEQSRYAALAYIRSHMNKFVSLEKYVELVQTSLALLICKDSKEPYGYLLEDEQRELVADAVNAVILSTNVELRDCLHSCMEKMLKQLTAFLYRRGYK